MSRYYRKLLSNKKIKYNFCDEHFDEKAHGKYNQVVP